jgi:DNA replication protein DnaC
MKAQALPRNMELALEWRGVPKRTIRACFDPTETPATEQIATPESLVVLAGLPGVGKSVAALLWLWEVSKQRPECMRWIQSGEIARRYAYDADAFDGITRIWALVIDDLGLDYVDDKGRYVQVLEEILDKRFANMRRTMVTTNIVETDVFEKRYGKRLYSRLCEDGAFIVCAGPDLRRLPR